MPHQEMPLIILGLAGMSLQTSLKNIVEAGDPNKPVRVKRRGNRVVYEEKQSAFDAMMDRLNGMQTNTTKKTEQILFHALRSDLITRGIALVRQ
jgi:hypothetical protein